MPRGVVSKDGDTNTAVNGYHYTRQNGKYRLTHHIIAEATLGRPIASDETVSFRDGNRKNLDPSNIEVTKRRTSRRGRIAALEARIMELVAQRDKLVAQEEEQRLKAARAKETEK